MRRWLLAFTVLAAFIVAPLEAAKDTPGLTPIPVVGASATGDVFNGTFTLQQFATDAAGKLVAVGTVAGTVTTATGQVVGSGLQTVAVPVTVGDTTNTAAVAGQAVSCGILHLDLGPLSLNLLGLQINLSRVVLDITAVPGAGNLLGNLLCAVAGLLDNPGGLARLLNQILSVLG